MYLLHRILAVLMYLLASLTRYATGPQFDSNGRVAQSKDKKGQHKLDDHHAQTVAAFRVCLGPTFSALQGIVFKNLNLEYRRQSLLIEMDVFQKHS